MGKQESTLGYAAAQPSTQTPRPLRLCQATGGMGVALFHSVGGADCGEHAMVLEHLGFVH